MEIFLFVVAAILFLIGLLGIILPAIPSLPVIWLGVLIYAYFTGFENVSSRIVFITGMMALGGTILDLIASALGAKLYGASWSGIIGAIAGGIIGFMIANIPGLLLGTAFGTFLGEYMRHKEGLIALKATWGGLLGFFLGSVIKLILAIWIIVLFVQAVF